MGTSRHSHSIWKLTMDDLFKNWLILALLAQFLTIWSALTTDTIQQRSTLRAYDANSMLLHDEFHIPIQKYSDPLHPNKDFTYFVSRMKPEEFQFKKFSHSTMSETVISTITLSGYDVFDICNNGDVLDYLVVMDTSTNTVSVISLKLSGTV